MDNKHIADKLLEIATLSAHTFPEDYTRTTTFKPHAWVLHAVREAYFMGQKEGLAAATAKHDFIQGQADEQYREARTSEIRAMTAYLLECMIDAGNTKFTGSTGSIDQVTTDISLEKLASVWSRWDYTTTRITDDIISITITKKD